MVNVLVSLLLSIIIVSGAVQWYQIFKKTVIAERAKGQNLEIGRTVLQYLMNDLKTSGYRGCRTLDDNFSIRRNFMAFSNLYGYFRGDRAVFGFRATSSYCQGRMPKTVCERLKEDSDLLIIYNVPGKIFSLKQDMNQSDEMIYTNQEKPMRKDSMVLISDCQQGDIFIASGVENERIFHQKGSEANLTNNLSKIYKKDAEVVELQTIAYYLGVPNRQKQDPLKKRELLTYALFRDDLLHEAEEIIEGIVDFEVEYGVWDPEFGIRYMPASGVPEVQWPKVYGIRLKLKTKTKHVWEYQIAIRNRQRVNLGSDITDSHLSFVSSYDGAGRFNH